MKNNLDALTRIALSVALDAPAEQRKQLFELLPTKGLFSGPYYTIGRFLTEDTVTNTIDIQAVAQKIGMDPVELATLYGLDETFRPLKEHLVRLLSVRQTMALSCGEDVTRWAAAIVRINEADFSSFTQKGEGQNLFIPMSEMMLQPVEVRPLLGSIIERGCTGQIFGPSGGGKTFIALDISCCVGTGSDWNGEPCEQGIVIYFAGEGHAGLVRRGKAWSLNSGGPDMSNIIISRTVITFDAGSISKVVAETRELEETSGNKVALIVIDTLARHLLGDENSTRDMSEFVRAVDGLRDAFPESSAIIVHHTGNDAEKAGRSRGSSALKAACDFEIQCDKGLLTFTKMKDGEQPPAVEFKLVQIPIGGEDKYGRSVTSCIVQYGERSAKNKEVALTANERMIFELSKASPGILVGDLRSNFYDKRREREPDVQTGTLKTAWLRAFQGLVDKQVLQENGHSIELYSALGQGTKTGHLSESPEAAQRHKAAQNDDMPPITAHGTKAAQSLIVTDEIDRHNRHTPYKGCAVVPSPIHTIQNSEIQRFDASDFDEVALT
jgi:hypothetical protein